MTAEQHYLEDVGAQFRSVKALAERALAQASDDELRQSLDPESNSLAVLVKHMAGNLRSRFTDFLTTDGEKPDRDRESEFARTDAPSSRAELMARWEAGWTCLFETLAALTPADLMREVSIRNERISVIQALDRALVHQSHHAGQIVFLAKHLRAGQWKTLSIPRRAQNEHGSGPGSATRRPAM